MQINLVLLLGRTVAQITRLVGTNSLKNVSREAFCVTSGQRVFSKGFDPVESENACCQVEFRTGSEIFKMAGKMAADV